MDTLLRDKLIKQRHDPQRRGYEND
jgi:hypothetical protein